MNAQELAKVWDIDNMTMMDYLLVVYHDDLDIVDENSIDQVELNGEEVSKILKMYVEDNYGY